MTIRVCVINGKGGCGKTTVSTHLAAALATSGLSTLLVDLDPYRGATHWHALRPATVAPIAISDWKRKFGAAPKGTQRIVVDCPASLRARRVREIVAECDLLVVPLLPSVFDRHATALFLDRVSKIKKVRRGRKRILTVSNRYKEGAAPSMQLEASLDERGHKPSARIADRAIYPMLAAQGLTVFDADTREATERQEEWMPLIEEIEALGRLSG